MPKRGGRGASIFSALPWDIKSVLRSNPSVDAMEPPAAKNHTPHPDDLLPTAPASDDDDDEVAAAVSVTLGTASSGSRSTSAPTSGKRVGSALASPSKRRRITATGGSTGEAAEEVKAENHPWDCTGLVPRYETPKDVPAHLKKYFFQRHSLWPAYSRLPLLMDDTGWFSVTPASIAEHIAERCRSDVVLDAFCGVGGNAIAFARTCERVIAMDNDLTRLRLARHNALHYGVADRIEFVLADYVEWAREYQRRGAHEREEVDVVFLSPPWGGVEYLSFGEGNPAYPLSAVLPVPGDELFALTAPITPNIAYYLPRNVDVGELAALARTLDMPQNDADDGAERDREWVEVEEEWVGDKLKAVTAYYGGLVEGL